MTTFLLPLRASTEKIGKMLGARLRAGDVVALIGDLGAGKTTLTQAIARGMGITEDVSSPTFALIHEYPGSIPLFHFDPYRLERAEDLFDLGFEEYFQREGIVVVEWADKFTEWLPAERLELHLAIVSDTAYQEESEDLPRLLNIEGIGERYQLLVRELERLPALQNLVREGSSDRATPSEAAPINNNVEAREGKPAYRRRTAEESRESVQG